MKSEAETFEMTGSRLVAGIDPGLATGGMVAIVNHKIVAVQSLKSVREENDSTGDPVFTDAILRAEKICVTVTQTLFQWEREWGPIQLIGIESFVDLPSRLRHQNAAGQPIWIKDRWKTPLVIGMMHAYLREYPLQYYNPAILQSFRDELSGLQDPARRGKIYPGAELLSNDHLMKAWCHAMYAYQKIANTL
jgi:hypothetical protein